MIAVNLFTVCFGTMTGCAFAKDMAPLAIEKPLVLKAYKTRYTGDGTWHDAAYIANHMNVGINLGNTMEAYEATNCATVGYTWIPKVGKNKPEDYERCWGSVKITQSVIDGMRDAGFDTVRIPVFWGNMMENDGTWTISPEFMNRVREIVDYCMKDDLYAVINIHHFDEFIIRRHKLEDAQVIFENVWTQIASYFANYGEKLIFEGFNEYLGGSQFNKSGRLVDPSREDAFKMANTLNQTFVKAVRSTGGNNQKRVLIVSGYWTNIDLTSSQEFVLPKDSVSKRMMVSVHYVDNSMFWEHKVGGQVWLDYIENQIGKLEKAFASKGIPVFLGETTSGYPSSCFVPSGAIYRTSSQCMEYVIKRLLDSGFVPVLWDTPEGFYSRKDCNIKVARNADVIKRMSEYARSGDEN